MFSFAQMSEYLVNIKFFETINEIDNILMDLYENNENVLNKICSIIPRLMSHYEICKSEIKYNGTYYKCEDFKKTELKLTIKEIYENNEIEINVYYTKPIITEKQIFKPEEYQILKIIAKRILSYLTYKSKFILIQNKKDNKQEYKENVINTLKKLSLKDDEIEVLLKNSVNFKKGETISKQKTNINYFFLIEKGYVKLTCENLYQHNFILKICKPYDFIGLSLIFNNSNQIFSINALTDSKIYFIDRNELERIIKNNLEFSNNIIKILSLNILFLINRINNIATKQALARVCDTLLYLSDEVFSNNIIEGIISRKDISELSALSNENTVRILSELKEMKVIDTIRNEIHILQKNKLLELSNKG